MLRARAVSAIYIESQALELLSAARRDVYKLFREYSVYVQVCYTLLELQVFDAKITYTCIIEVLDNSVNLFSFFIILNYLLGPMGV